MTTFFLAPSLDTLRDDVNAKYPNRDKASDGWIGDPSHAARESDHNPDWDAPGKQAGIVRAVDIDSNGAPGVLTPLVKDVLAAAIGDPRVWYVIWNSKIYSRTYGWSPHVYIGSNPHDHHVHVSILHTADAAFDTSPWIKETPKPIAGPPALSTANVVNAYRHPRKATNPVATKRVQRALSAHGFNVRIDGVYGPATRAAMKAYEATLPHARADGRPGTVTLTALGKNRWRLTR